MNDEIKVGDRVSALYDTYYFDQCCFLAGETAKVVNISEDMIQLHSKRTGDDHWGYAGDYRKTNI